MASPNSTEVIIAISSSVTPILIAVLSIVAWKYKQSIERQDKLEERLRDDRISIYNEILKPFIILLTSDTAWESDPKNRSKDKSKTAEKILLSSNYRTKSFEMSLLASDGVLTSYNDLMQFLFSSSEQDFEGSDNTKTIMDLLGSFLLEIRRSMGNETTKIDSWQMLEWFMPDARSLRPINKK